MFYLVSYDIPDDRRRDRVARALKRVAERVQYSVFEAEMKPADMQKLVRRLTRLVDEGQDSVRIYAICAECKPRVTIIGRGEVLEIPDLVII